MFHLYLNSAKVISWINYNNKVLALDLGQNNINFSQVGQCQWFSTSPFCSSISTKRLQKLFKCQENFCPRVWHPIHPLGSTFSHLPILLHKLSWQIFLIYGFSITGVVSPQSLDSWEWICMAEEFPAGKKAFKSCCHLGCLLVITTGSTEFRNWDQILKQELSHCHYSCPLRVPSPCLGHSLRGEQEAGTALVTFPCSGTELPVCFLVIFVNYVFSQLAQSHLITQLGPICNLMAMFSADLLSVWGAPVEQWGRGNMRSSEFLNQLMGPQCLLSGTPFRPLAVSESQKWFHTSGDKRESLAQPSLILKQQCN